MRYYFATQHLRPFSFRNFNIKFLMLLNVASILHVIHVMQLI